MKQRTYRDCDGDGIEFRIDQDSGAACAVLSDVPEFGTIVSYQAFIIDEQPNINATLLAPRVRWADSTSDIDGSVIIQLAADATNPLLAHVAPLARYRAPEGRLYLDGAPDSPQTIRHVVRIIPGWRAA